MKKNDLIMIVAVLLFYLAAMPCAYAAIHDGGDEYTCEISASDISDPAVRASLKERISGTAICAPAVYYGKNNPRYYAADRSYFDDALFIGDSRIDALKEYGRLDNADFFSRIGMSLYNIDDKRVDVDGLGRVSLSELLSRRKYGKIYITLGLNEIGYNHARTAKRYRELVDRIAAAQPDAIIYIQANLHVSAAYSASSRYENNHEIDLFNSMIRDIADNDRAFYLDANELYDDGSGAMRSDISGDGVHPYGRYYSLWGDWLCAHTVRR